MRRLAGGLVVTLAIALVSASPAAALELWAVGDGADSGSNDDQVAAYVQSRSPEHFLYLGDVYPASGGTEGSAQIFQDYYQPSFGRFLPFTNPTPGNHEWPNRAQGYDPYFGGRAPQTAGGHWYSFDAGGWHFVSLNSEESLDEGSAQLAWLRSDVASQPGNCTVAFMHKPRFTDGLFAGSGYDTKFAAAWSALSGKAVALLSGHDHNYQRFKPVDGIVQFVAGTGGHGLFSITPSDRLAAWDDTTYGALHLSLTPGVAGYEFMSSGGVALDAGSLTCTNPPPDPGPQPPADPGPSPVAPGPAPPGTAPAPAPAHDDDPLVLIGRPRSGSVQSRRLRLLAGTAVNVKPPIRIVLVRTAGSRCRALGPKGFRYSCAKAPWWRARGLRPWRLRLGRALARGSYRLTAYSGKASDVATFRIR